MYPMHNFGPGFGWGPGAVMAFAPFLVLVLLWSLFWKGLALWHSARRGQGWWFIVMLILNTAGILEIIYLFGVLKLKSKDLFENKPPHNHNHH